MTLLVKAMIIARAYAARHNRLVGDDPDDIAEAWNDVREEMDFRTGCQLSPRQLDLVADEVLRIWTTKR